MLHKTLLDRRVVEERAQRGANAQTSNTCCVEMVNIIRI